MGKRRRLSVNEYAEVETLDHMDVISPILIRRNMQPHPINFQLNHNHHSQNHSMNHDLINSFNNGQHLNTSCLTNHHNYSINTSQTSSQQHSSPIIFHSPTQQPQHPPQSSSVQQQAQQTMQRASSVFQNSNLIDLRYNQRSQLHGPLSNRCNCNVLPCINNYSNSGNIPTLNNGNSLNNNSINFMNNASNNLTNCNNFNNQFSNNSYQRNIQQQNNSPQRLSPSRHRFRNNNNRWARFINNNYQINPHLSSMNNQLNQFQNLGRINHSNNLIHSNSSQSSLSPILNNLATTNLINNNSSNTLNSNIFNNIENLYNSENCSNTANNLNSNNISGSSINNNYHPRRYNISGNISRSRQRESSSNGNISNNGLNSFNSLNSSFIGNNYNANLISMSNTHQSNPNNFFVNNSNNLIQDPTHIMRVLALFGSNPSAIPQINPNILQHNLNVINQLTASNISVEFLNRTLAFLNNFNYENNEYHQPQFNHYPSSQYFHHNSNQANNNTASGSSNNNLNTSSTDPQQVENYEALLNLAHRLGEAKTRGLSKAEIDLLPSYKFRSSICSKSLKSSLKSKSHRCNNKTIKNCKHNKSKFVDSNNNHSSNIDSFNSIHSEEEENYEYLDDLEENEDLLMQKNDKLNKKKNKLNKRCLRLNKSDNFISNEDESNNQCCELIEQEDEKICCVICMCDFEIKQLLRILPCYHEFHARCIDKWLKSNRTCPICRGDALKIACESE